LGVALGKAFRDNEVHETVAIRKGVAGLVASKAQGRGSLVLGDRVDNEIDFRVAETVIGAGAAKGTGRVRLDPPNNGMGSRRARMEHDGRGSVAAEFCGVFDEGGGQLR
jgi:hypothetical protein